MTQSPESGVREKWDRIWREAKIAEPEAARVLVENRHLLPSSGDALDLACGLGGNALLLARQGLRTRAWDISPVAVENVNRRAERLRLDILAEPRDVEVEPPAGGTFDVIVVSRFLYRPLGRALTDALRPGGLLFYQTYIRDKLSAAGPSSLDYLLAPNELLALFQPLQLLFYREEGRVGDITEGFRDEAMLVARKS
ncbi:bifunctional 2-polyprenyl-6-hydroxyphenol methylase/3-demethylubiquinol 3-O-methyltransferase UbiG [Methylococcus sp. EFPC2]|uniref:class I SAM-dependent methyltransferase n=1 Tax=Methylococcus sp. EFPC2 TaxID=2812648 RepID=UPI0019685AAA|nr:class I SAM-dependent methyltransferase [Methylococcus sp. EFPC2]QSA96826.1 class I SAM-dependent methyltransferase [Methylococcus sp. EFPC2]